MESNTENSSIRFLSFSNDKEDAEKVAKLKEAALKIEQAIAKEKSLNELIEYKQPEGETIDPLNDSRPLYERLLEQRNKKQEELEESHKLSNLVTKLDEEDAAYLNEVARSKNELEVRKRLEVYDALEEKKRFDAKRALEQESKLKSCLVDIKSSGSSSAIKSKLSSMIKVKPRSKNNQNVVDTGQSKSDQNHREPSESDCPTRSSAKRTNPDTTDDSSSKIPRNSDNRRIQKDSINFDRDSNDPSRPPEGDEVASRHIEAECRCARKDVMQCIGILPSLPQVDEFQDSSDSDDSGDDVHHQMFKARTRR